MREIREIDESELGEMLRITTEAFPGFYPGPLGDRSPMLERLDQIRQQPIVHFFGVFDDGRMVAVMRCYDFTAKLRSTRTLVGGVGGVAVDLRHKKEHIAADMINFYHDYYRNKGAALTALYPFRPDFYKRMGYGFGTKMNRYAFRPDALPGGGSKANVDFLSNADKADLNACYDRFVERSSGLFELPPHMLDNLFSDSNLHLLGYRRDGRLEGYMTFTIERAHTNNTLLNNMAIRDLVYDHPAALRELLAFVRSQADQYDRVIYETQDDRFFFLLSDPRNTSGNLLKGLWHEVNTQGLGIMYRVIDVRRLFDVLADHDFGGQTVRLGIALTDTFLPQNAGETVVVFRDGRATIGDSGAADVTVRLDISEFSSLAVGTVGFKRLYEYGLAELSDVAYLEMVERLFHTDQPPLSMTHF
jgi:predicted acetyltransferase